MGLGDAGDVKRRAHGGQAATYYEEKYSRDDYYTEKQRVVGRWFGRGAAELGLDGDIDTADFRAVLNGLNPRSGEIIVHAAQREGEPKRAGWDATFNAPKSVSVQALVGEDARLIAAHRRAVERSLQELGALRPGAHASRTGMGNHRQGRRRALRSYRCTSRLTRLPMTAMVPTRTCILTSW